MTDQDYDRKLDELDRLLNDPEVSMQPARIWSLLAELSVLNGQATPIAGGEALGGRSVQAVGDYPAVPASA